MSIKKSAIKEWPDSKARQYLDQQYPGQRIEWRSTFDDSLYAHKTEDGSEFTEMDDDAIRVAGIVEFLIRSGGTYESN